jgi:outer membrane immunogenic protein
MGTAATLRRFLVSSPKENSMRLFNTLATAALISTAGLGLTAVHAADLITMPVSSSAVEIPVSNPGYDWSGFYTGVYGVVQNSPNMGMQYGLGINAGVNAQFDFFLVGAEVAIHGLTGGAFDTTYGQVIGKAGVVLSDAVMLYAAAGYGIDLGAPAEDDFLLGGGVEVALADNISMRAQYLHGFPITGGNPKDQFTVGAHFKF